MKTIRQHWESLPNKKLGEWLMKQGIYQWNENAEYESEFEALNFAFSWDKTGIRKVIEDAYELKSWQPLLDALPELREDDHVGNVTEMVQQQQDTRRAEVVQLVAAIVMSNGLLSRKDIDYTVSSAIMLQAEIDKQLKGQAT